MTGWVEKRSQVIENTLEPGSFFMKLRRPEGVGDKLETIHPVAYPEMRRSCLGQSGFVTL